MDTLPVPGPDAAECRSLDAVPAVDRQEVWQDILSTMLLPMSVRLAPETRPGFRGRVRRHWLDDMALVECRTDPFTGRRGRAEIAPGDDEFIAVLLYTAGHEYISQRDTTLDVRSGGGVVLSSSSEFRFAVPVPYYKRCLVIPTAALAEVSDLPRSGCVELNHRVPAVSLLDGYVDTLVRTLPALSDEIRTAARNATLELVAAVLRDGGMDTKCATPALRASMDAWIERHLCDPRLCPDALAAAHAVSVRTVHRLYGSDGDTFGAVVRRRRLERARQELISGDRSVSSLAAQWGFADASHFSRSFKTAFGMSPRDYRASVSAGPAS
ncbi:helix-turn-helix domain-containing protein [Streptomyces sp. ME19-01-6]|uniref:helix-turn-helix domain-containing protein n=1 Tax=Streptomyces sp. ME19-01-6 TaxID=3028686 RepID=UPI0029A4A637|nr:helix-turn-helix domain-containing protein [Streptomyces sp. ME19-01-6]MDX3233567.1 helix-turn-helix domain-containing protein [Streptomyces sp. ME19-01-6]